MKKIIFLFAFLASSLFGQEMKYWGHGGVLGQDSMSTAILQVDSIMEYTSGHTIEVADTIDAHEGVTTPNLRVDNIKMYTAGHGIDIHDSTTFKNDVVFQQIANEYFIIVGDADTLRLDAHEAFRILSAVVNGDTIVAIDTTGKVVFLITDASNPADGTVYNQTVVSATESPALNAEVGAIQGAYNWSKGDNQTFTAEGVEGVVRVRGADENMTARGVYGRFYIDPAYSATLRTGIGGEFSARASYNGGTGIAAESGTAFVGVRIWMAPWFTGATIGNVNNFHGLWLHNEHTSADVTNAIYINGATGGGSWTNFLNFRDNADAQMFGVDKSGNVNIAGKAVIADSLRNEGTELTKGLATFKGGIDADYAETATAADPYRYHDFRVDVNATQTASAGGGLATLYGRIDWDKGDNSTASLGGIEGVASSSSADEAISLRGGHFRTYINANADAAGSTARTSVGLEISARAGYSGANAVQPESGTAFVGGRIWMAPYFATSVANINNFHGLWLYNEHPTYDITNGIYINSVTAGASWTNFLNFRDASDVEKFGVYKSGELYAADSLTTASGIRAEGGILAKGASTIDDKLVVNDSLRVELTSIQKGDATFNGKVVVGDSLRNEGPSRLKGVVTVDDDIIPAVNGGMDIGRTSYHVDSIYAATISHGTTDLKLGAAGGEVIIADELGINTAAPDKPLEVNHATGAGIRTTYNDADGTATYYVDYSVSSAGDGTILPSGMDMNIGANTENYLPTLSLLGDADSDGGGNITVENYKTELVQNATPGSAYWKTSSTQSKGTLFSNPVSIGAVAPGTAALHVYNGAYGITTSGVMLDADGNSGIYATADNQIGILINNSLAYRGTASVFGPNASYSSQIYNSTNSMTTPGLVVNTSSLTTGIGGDMNTCVALVSAAEPNLIVNTGGASILNASSLASESLTNGVLTSGTGWTVTGDFALASNKATYTHSAGSGTLYQASGSLAIAGTASKWYKFQYTTSSVTGTITMTITTDFASESWSLYQTSAGTYTVYFKSAASPGDFKISITTSAAATITLDDLTLKEVTDGDLFVTDDISAGSYNMWTGEKFTTGAVQWTESATDSIDGSAISANDLPVNRIAQLSPSFNVVTDANGHITTSTALAVLVGDSLEGDLVKANDLPVNRIEQLTASKYIQTDANGHIATVDSLEGNLVKANDLPVNRLEQLTPSVAVVTDANGHVSAAGALSVLVGDSLEGNLVKANDLPYNRMEQLTASKYIQTDANGHIAVVDSLEGELIKANDIPVNRLAQLTASKGLLTDANGHLVVNDVTGTGNTVLATFPTFTDSILVTNKIKTSASALTIDIAGTGNSYLEVIQDNNAGMLAVGRTTATESSVLSITDGGGDNEPGFLSLYDDGGTGHYIWMSTDNVLRASGTLPADDDAGGYAIMDNDDGTIGASTQPVLASTVTATSVTASNIVQNAEVWVTSASQNPALVILPANAKVLSVECWVSELFDSDGTDEVTVGYDAAATAYATAITVSATGVQTVTLGATAKTVDATSRAVEVYYTNGGSEPTTGKAHVSITYIQATVSP